MARTGKKLRIERSTLGLRAWLFVSGWAELIWGWRYLLLQQASEHPRHGVVG
jgi:hypothetical protein